MTSPLAVVLKATSQQIRSMDYVAAAKAAGCSVFWIISREILPNAFNNLVVVATLEIGRAILLEAAFSFLGMGVQPPIPSWGLMIAESTQEVLAGFFNNFLAASVLMFGLVMAFNMFADALQDALDPRKVS